MSRERLLTGPAGLSAGLRYSTGRQSSWFSSSFNHFVRRDEESWRYRETKRLDGLEVNRFPVGMEKECNMCDSFSRETGKEVVKLSV